MRVSTVAQNVLDKSPLQLDGAGLKVFPDMSQNRSRSGDKSHRLAKSDRQEDSDKGQHKTMWDGKTIEVTGLKQDTTGDAILLLLESELPDDDVACLRIQRHPDRDVIYITFETHDG